MGKSSATVDTIEELSIDDFNSAGSLGGVEYTNGCSLYALFLGDEIEQQEEYRVLLNGNGGEITGSALPGQTKILLTYKEDELKSLDVSKYAAEREGCTFCGWGCNGEILTSALDKSYFKSGDSLVIYALYKKTTFEGTSYVLNLDANGGMIEDEFVKSTIISVRMIWLCLYFTIFHKEVGTDLRDGIVKKMAVGKHIS